MGRFEISSILCILLYLGECGVGGGEDGGGCDGVHGVLRDVGGGDRGHQRGEPVRVRGEGGEQRRRAGGGDRHHGGQGSGGKGRGEGSVRRDRVIGDYGGVLSDGWSILRLRKPAEYLCECVMCIIHIMCICV